MESGQERYIIKIEQEGGEDVVKIYDQIEKKGVQAGQKLDEAAKKVAKAEIESAKETIKANEQKVAEIRKQYDRLEKAIVAKQSALGKMGASGGYADAKKKEINDLLEQQKKLDAEAEKYVKELKQAEAVVSQLETLIGSGADKQQTMRTELRNAKEEAQRLLTIYRSMSEAEKQSAEGLALAKHIDELIKKAGVLKDAMDDVNRSAKGQASDTRSFDALTEGLDSVISLYGVAQGAAVAYGISEQELMAMQTKLQAVLSASNALKTLQNNLQKESNMMMAVANVQAWAQAKAEAAAASATAGHTIAQKAFNFVARQNPYVILATACLSLIGVIALFVKSTNAATEKQKKMADAAKKMAESQKHMQDAIGEAVSSSVAKFKTLESQWRRLRNEADKTKWIKDNASAFDTLNLSVTGVNDADEIFIKRSKEVIQALTARARANATSKLYEEAYANKIKNDLNKNRANGRAHSSYKVGDKIGSEQKAILDELGLSSGYTWKGLISGSTLESKKAADALTDYYKKKADVIKQEEKDNIKKLEDLMIDAEEQAQKAEGAISDLQKTTDNPTPKNPSIRKEEAAEMANVLNEGSKAWFESVIGKLREELENTPKYFEGALNPEYDQVVAEIQHWEELFKEAFGDNSEQLRALLEEFGTIDEKRAKVKSEYRQKRETMSKNPGMFSSANLAELDKQEQETLDALDMEFAQKELTFKAWMESLTDLTIAQLEDALKMAQDELKKAEEVGDGNNTAIARAKVASVQDRLAKAKIKTKPEEGSVKEWNELYKVLVDCSKEFDEIGDVVGGVAGDIIKAAGNIATSAVTMINGIQTLAKSSIDATKAAATGAAEAISTAEKASVILTVISAALQVVTAVFNMLGTSSSQKSYERAQKAYEGTVKALDWAIDKQLEYASVLAGADAMNAYEKAIAMAKNLSDAARVLGSQYLNAGASIRSRSNGYNARSNISEKAWAEGADALGMTVETFQKMLGGRLTGLFTLSIEQLEKLKGDAASFYGSLDAETQKYWDAVIENEQKAQDILQDQMTQLSTLKQGEMADNWKSMLADMSVTGKDFADDFEKNLSNAIINSLVDAKYGQRLEAIRKKIAEGMADGTMEGSEAQALRDEYNAIASIAMREAKQALEDAGIADTLDQSFNRETAASVTQETMDEVNGRLTAVQVDLQMMVSIGQMSQMNLANIERYTSYIPAMASDIATMRADIADKL